jgi:tRNA-splicing ligase RtcB
LKNIANMPFIFKHVAVMPDVHLGKGATVGSVIATKGAIIPAAVGVDIGCGMIAVRTSLKAEDLPDTLHHIRAEIEKLIPVGMAEHDKPGKLQNNAWKNLSPEFDKMVNENKGLAKMTRNLGAKVVNQLGSLGGGNHFVEICLDENSDVWIMLHSGSRGTGNIIGRFFIEHARNEMERMFIHLPDKDLAYLAKGDKMFDDYVHAVGWAQDYARKNRDVMLQLVIQAMQLHLPAFSLTKEAINCHHNFVERENHFGENVFVTRKGAVRAREGDLGIIPGSMGAKSFIVRGKGNCDSFHSCSHGAGRVMSRGKAKEMITLDDHIKATAGVECRKDEGVLDESPAAYKDIDLVMASQSDLVEVVHTLKQVLCVKG